MGLIRCYCTQKNYMNNKKYDRNPVSQENEWMRNKNKSKIEKS